MAFERQSVNGLCVYLIEEDGSTVYTVDAVVIYRGVFIPFILENICVTGVMSADVYDSIKEIVSFLTGG